MQSIVLKEKIVAFDLDGTLIDSAPDITSALNYVLKSNKLKPVSLQEVKKLIGSGARALIKDAFFKQDKKIKDIDFLNKEFLKEYNKCFKNKTKLYPNTEFTIQNLVKNNYKLVLVSNKPEFYCLELLKHFGLLKYFCSVSGGDTFKYRKPDAHHLYKTIRKAGIKNYQCIFVGDSKYDLDCAKNANIPCILLSHGYSKLNINKLGADKVLNDLKHLLEEVDLIYRAL